MLPPKHASWTESEKKEVRKHFTAAVAAGLFPRASTLKCIDCGDPAKDYDHHLGYDKSNTFKVEPVCRSCHVARDHKGRTFPRIDAVFVHDKAKPVAFTEDATVKSLVLVQPTALALPEDKVHRVVTQFFARRSPYTIEGYKQDLQRFAEYLELLKRGAKKPERESAIAEATRHLFSLSAVDANYTVMQYVAWMEDAKTSPATINRRLSALKSLVKLGQMLGAVSWTLGVRGVKSQKMRDVRGPTVEQVQQMLAVAQAQLPPARAARDTAMVSMFFALGLRGVEVRELRLEHLDLSGGRILVRGKGRTERAPQTLPTYVNAALRAWLLYRGNEPGPLFRAIGKRKSTAAGLTRASVWGIIHKLGVKVGIRAWPHGLRHAAVTESLELLDGDVRAVRKFSRHERVQTVMDYDDARVDMAGRISEKLAQRLNEVDASPIRGTESPDRDDPDLELGEPEL